MSAALMERNDSGIRIQVAGAGPDDGEVARHVQTTAVGDRDGRSSHVVVAGENSCRRVLACEQLSVASRPERVRLSASRAWLSGRRDSAPIAPARPPFVEV